MQDKERLKQQYKAAKRYAEENDAPATREQVLGMLKTMKSLYLTTSGPQLEKIKEFIVFWVDIAAELRTVGISPKVRKAFCIPEMAVQSQGWCADIFAQNVKNLVEITVYDEYICPSAGTGVIISPKGYLLTNNHVVINSLRNGPYHNLLFNFADSDQNYSMSLIATNPEHDIALCSFDGSLAQGRGVRFVKNYSQLQAGAAVLNIGNSAGMGLSPSEGIVKYVKDNGDNLIYTAPTNNGDSGGAVFNNNGECVGINKSKITRVNNYAIDGMRRATTAETIAKLLQQWCDEKNICL